MSLGTGFIGSRYPPNGMIIQQIGEDYILGHTRDELGVEYVQVWPLERWTSPDSERE